MRLRIDTKGASRQDGAHYDVHQDALYARLFRNVHVPYDVRPRIRSEIYRCLVSCDVVCDTVVASLTNEMLVNMLYECFVLTNAYVFANVPIFTSIDHVHQKSIINTIRTHALRYVFYREMVQCEDIEISTNDALYAIQKH